MTRRDALKYFTAGASTVPIIGGLPLAEARPNLIDEPKVEIKSADALPPRSQSRVLVDGRSWDVEIRLKSRDGQEVLIAGNSFLMNRTGTRLVFNSEGFISELPYPFRPDVEWELRELFLRPQLGT